MFSPPFPNPWSDKPPVPNVNVYDPNDSIWPDRLLHVPTMTSQKGEFRDGRQFFDKTPNPRYNVLSYTWGFYRDDQGQTPTIKIHNLPWKVPSIMTSHFTADQFHNAIKHAAHGVLKQPCDWLWVDIACIPQEDRARGKTEHDGKDSHSRNEEERQLDEELRRLSAQEIGRQVAIFNRAEESFVWLTGLTTSYLQEKGSRIRVQALENYVLHLGHEYSAGILANINLQVPADLPREVHLVRQKLGEENPIDIAAYYVLLLLSHEANLFSSWITCILGHKWCMSLWTLQEMVLRPDAWLLLNDGLLDIESDQQRLQGARFRSQMFRDLFRTKAITSNKSGKWSLSDIKFEIRLLGALLNAGGSSKMWDRIKSIETRLKDRLGLKLKNQIPSVRGIQERLGITLRLMRLKGMNALHISFPHTAYSAAQHRRSKRTLDRISGIVQTYGISCQSFPPEDKRADEEKLKDLQDDFGSQLVSKMPLLSQLFIHSLAKEGGQVQRPRRSWLITENCDVQDGWWSNFESGYKIVNLFDSFQAVQNSGTLKFEFKGRAWDIESFVHPVAPPLSNFDSLFTPLNDAVGPSSYHGLMLDHHVSLAVLDDSTDLFRSHKAMEEAVTKLQIYYGKDFAGNDCPILRVASLGCSYIDALPHVQHVGIVLAPSPKKQGAHDCESGKEAEDVWCRIGLMRWVEDYSSYGKCGKGRPEEKHPQLPTPDDFSCLIE